MHRIDASGNVAGEFTDGDPGTNTPATVVDSPWLNDVQEELVNAVLSAGIALVKGTQTQLRDAILSLARRPNLGAWPKRQNSDSFSAGGNERGLWYLGGLWIALSGDAAHAAKIVTSPDSFWWTSRTHPLGSTDYPNGVAIGGDNGSYVIVAGNGKILTSPDGFTWTSQTSGVAVALNDVACDGAQFVAVGGDGSTPVILTSPDGVTWTSQTVPAGIGTITHVTVGGGVWVASVQRSPGGSYGFITSSDGVTWTLQAYSSTPALCPIGYGAGLFVSSTEDSPMASMITSPDGITWTARTLPVGTSDTGDIIQGIIYSEGRFVAASKDGYVFTSADGITWKQRGEISATLPLHALATDGDVYAVSGLSGTSGIYATTPVA